MAKKLDHIYDVQLEAGEIAVLIMAIVQWLDLGKTKPTKEMKIVARQVAMKLRKFGLDIID